MTKKEFSLIALALRAYFPKENNFIPNEQAMELWYFQLKDLDYKVAEAAVNKWAATNKWSPTIADLRETALTITLGELPEWGEAWQEVTLAIRRYGSYRAGDALKSLSPLTKKVVERLGYLQLCASENIAADRANFRMIFEQLAAREKKQAQLPEGLKVLIAQMQQDKLLEG